MFVFICCINYSRYTVLQNAAVINSGSMTLPFVEGIVQSKIFNFSVFMYIFYLRKKKEEEALQSKKFGALL